jgi:hypothetical protein
VLELFEPVATFSLPPEEYTICDCPSQTTKLVARRRRERRLVRDP